MSTFSLEAFVEDRDTFLNAQAHHDSLLAGLDLLQRHAIAQYEIVAGMFTKVSKIIKKKYDVVYKDDEQFEFNVAYADFMLEALHAQTPPSLVRVLRSPDVDIKLRVVEDAEKRLPGAKTSSAVADIAITSIYRDAIIHQLGLFAGRLDADVRVVQHYLAMYNNEKLTTLDKEIMLSQLHHIIYNSVRDINVVALEVDFEYLEREIH